MDIGTLTGQIQIEDELSSRLNIISNTVSQFAQMFDGTMGMIAVSVGIATTAVGALSASVIALGNTGSAVDDVTRTFERFAGGAENAAQALELMRVGTKGTVTDLDLMQKANRLLAADVKLTADQMGTLSQAAFVLADQGLGSVEQMLDVVSTAMLTGRTRMLEMKIGKIDLKKAEEDFAKSLGVSVKELSAEGVVQARRLGILSTLNDRVQKAGEIERDFGDIMKGVVVTLRNWGNELARSVANSPNVMKAVDAIGDALSETFGTTGQTMIDAIVRGINKFADVVAQYAPIVIQFFGRIRDGAIDLWNWLTEMNERFQITDTIVKGAKIAWDFLTSAVDFVSDAISGLKSAWEELPKWLQDSAKGAAAMGAGLYITGTAINAAASPFANFIKNLDLGINILGNFTSGARAGQEILRDLFPNIGRVGEAFKGLGTTLSGFTFAPLRSLASEVVVVTSSVKTLGVQMAVTSAAQTAWSTFMGSTLVSGIKAVGLAIGSFFLSPIGLVIGAITLLVGGLRILTGSWDFLLVPLKAGWQLLKDVWTISTELASIVGESLGPVLSDLGTVFSVVGGIIKTVFVAALEEAREEVFQLWDLLKQAKPLQDLVLAVNLVHFAAEQIRRKRAAAEVPELPAVSPLITLPGTEIKPPVVPSQGLAPPSFPNFLVDQAEVFRKKVQELKDSILDTDRSTKVFAATFDTLTSTQKANEEVLGRLIPLLDQYAEAHHGALTPAMRETYDAAIKVQQAYRDEAENQLKLQNVTLEGVEAQKAQGLSLANIARSYEVTTADLQAYLTKQQEQIRVTDDLVKAQDALIDQQTALSALRLEGAGAQQLAVVEENFESRLISAEQYATQRKKIEEGLIADRIALEDRTLALSEARELRSLNERVKREAGNTALQQAAEQMRSDIVAKYALQRETLYVKEQQRRQNVQTVGMQLIAKTEREFTELAASASRTRLDQQIHDIDEWADHLIATSNLQGEELTKYTDLVRQESQRQKDGLFIDGQAIVENSKRNLYQIAGVTRMTYEFMKSHPEQFSKYTIDRFKDIADAAQDAADGTKLAWMSAFHDMTTGLSIAMAVVDQIPGKFGDVAGKVLTHIKNITDALARGDWIGAIVAGIAAIGDGIAALFRHPGREAAVEFMESFDTALSGTGADELQAKIMRLVNGEQLWKQLTQERDVNKVKKTIEDIQDAFAELDHDIQQYNLTWMDLIDAQDEASASGLELAETYNRLVSAGYEVSRVQEQMNDDISEYIINAVDAGVKIPAAMRPIIEEMIRAGQLTNEAAKAILGLRDKSVPSLDEIRDAAGRYGIELDKLGPKVKQLEIDELADQYVADWKILTAATDDWGVIIDKMGPKVQSLITDAIKYGLELPAAMQPMIQAMIDAGELVDNNGDKLTDLSQLNFAKPLTEMVEALIAKLDELVEAIIGPSGVGGAFDRLSRKEVSEIVIPYRYEAQNEIEEPSMMASGGVVRGYAEGGAVREAANIIPFAQREAPGFAGGAGPATIITFKPRGSDIVPAMLTPGERVLSVPTNQEFEQIPAVLDSIARQVQSTASALGSLKAPNIGLKLHADVDELLAGVRIPPIQVPVELDVEESLLTGSLARVREVISPEEIKAAVRGYQQALAEGFRGTQEEFLRQQLDFYAVLDEGDERLKTWFYSQTLDAYGGLNKRLDAVRAAMQPDELQALVAGYQQALASGFEGTRNEFLRQQLDFYHTLEEGDERLKTWFYGSTLDAYDLIRERLNAAKSVMGTDELQALVSGYTQALASGFKGTQDEFLRQQLDFYHTLEEGDKRLKTWFYARTIDAYDLVVASLDVRDALGNVEDAARSVPEEVSTSIHVAGAEEALRTLDRVKRGLTSTSPPAMTEMPLPMPPHVPGEPRISIPLPAVPGEPPSMRLKVPIPEPPPNLSPPPLGPLAMPPPPREERVEIDARASTSVNVGGVTINVDARGIDNPEELAEELYRELEGKIASRMPDRLSQGGKDQTKWRIVLNGAA